MHHREELQNLGLRIILTSGIELSDFEISYIQDCLRKDPYEDGGILFDIMLDGTLYGGIYNLDMYLDILLGLKIKMQFLMHFIRSMHVIVGMIVLSQKISSNIILHWKIRENNCRFKRLLNYICCVLNYMM